MEQANLENFKNLEELKKEVEKEVSSPEATPQEKRKVLGRVIEEKYFPPKAPSGSSSTTLTDLTEIEKVKEQYKPLITELIEIAQEEGIEKAVDKAQEVSKDNPYLLDAFHDELVDKYFYLLGEG
jgi:hypothetical protein